MVLLNHKPNHYSRNRGRFESVERLGFGVLILAFCRLGALQANRYLQLRFLFRIYWAGNGFYSQAKKMKF